MNKRGGGVNKRGGNKRGGSSGVGAFVPACTRSVLRIESATSLRGTSEPKGSRRRWSIKERLTSKTPNSKTRFEDTTRDPPAAPSLLPSKLPARKKAAHHSARPRSAPPPPSLSPHSLNCRRRKRPPEPGNLPLGDRWRSSSRVVRWLWWIEGVPWLSLCGERRRRSRRRLIGRVQPSVGRVHDLWSDWGAEGQSKSSGGRRTYTAALAVGG